MENKDQKLLEEIEKSKNWMKFLDNKKNYNRSFHQTESSSNPKPLHEAKIRESMFEDKDESGVVGSPEQPSDDLLLGGPAGEDMVKSENGGGVFIIVSTDVNGTIHTNMIESDSEQDAVQQSDNEMLTQIFAVAEEQLLSLISKLTQYLPEDIESENVPDKPPFIDEPKQDVIDEDGIVDPTLKP